MSTLPPPIAPSSDRKRSFSDANSNNSNENLQNYATIKPSGNGQPQIIMRELIQRKDSTPLSSPGLSRASSPTFSKDGGPKSSIPCLESLASITDKEGTSKRRKLTSTEKELKRQEKEVRDKQKAEEKAKKEVEKREKDELKRIRGEEAKAEKRKKEEEKEAKRSAREAVKRSKDQEKQSEKRAKDNKNIKNEMSQTKLNIFFTRPSSVQSLGPPLEAGHTSPSGCQNSTAGSEKLEEQKFSSRTRLKLTSPQNAEESDYGRFFKPFSLSSHSLIAPSGQPLRDENELQLMRDAIDDSLKQHGSPVQTLALRFPNFAQPLYQSYHKIRQHERMQITVKSIVRESQDQKIEHSSDLVGPPRAYSRSDLLKSIPTKYLRFAEDVRPPYIGTYSKTPASCFISKLCRKPFTRALPHTNYDYDSEAEWEEPGEGEDLDSEGEEEQGEDDEAEDLDGFLDDEDATQVVGAASNKRRPAISDVEPICTGLCWEPSYESKQLQNYRLETILDVRLPLNPYSEAYWPSSTQNISTGLRATYFSNSQNRTMDPPRLPLHAIDCLNPRLPISSQHSLADPASTKPIKPVKEPKLVASELLDAFKTAVNGSDLTKAGLIEVLKKRFPKTGKDTIRDTLGVIAERLGPKEAEKRWVVREFGV